MADRLRELLDLVVASVGEPGVDGRALARRAHFSRDHLDRIVVAATGESPVALRRRLLLERAAWQLRAGAAASEAARAAGYRSLAAFSRAFARAFGVAPSRFAAAAMPMTLAASNGLHFHPPAGLLLPGPTAGAVRDPLDRLVDHHLDHARALLEACAALSEPELRQRRRPGFVAVWFEGEEASAALMAERLVHTLELWVAAVVGRPAPPPRPEDPATARLERFEPAARSLRRLLRGLADRRSWDDAFVDALCEPPQSFTYGGVAAHVVTYGAVRRHALMGVLHELGAVDADGDDPLLWEMRAAGRR